MEKSRLLQRRLIIQLLLIPIVVALWLGGQVFKIESVNAQTTMPTPDRLAQPTLPANASQADKGAQVYWLACLPCHGDRGQGLTDEFRKAYPEEDQNCWNSGCHGKNPYESGFTLPKTIPAVIQAGALQKFPNALVLRSYIQSAMPFWKPGNLTEEESWQVTAFLLRENGIWSSGTPLTEENASSVGVAPTPTPAAMPPGNPLPADSSPWGSLLFVGLVTLPPLLLLLWIFRKK